MFFNSMELFTVEFEIENGLQKSVQTMQAPRMMLEAQFINYMQETSNIPHPVRIKMSIKTPYFDEYENKTIINEDYVEFLNKAYVDEEKEKQNGENNKKEE